MALGDLLSLTVRGSAQFDLDVNGFGVDGNGWVAELLISGLPSIDPTTVNANKISLVLSDPGFDKTGSVVTQTRTVRGGKVLRKQATNDDQLWVSNDGNGNTLIRFSLEEDVYQGTTISSATVGSGLYAGAATGAIPTIVNNSTWAYRKAIVGWGNRQFERATGAGYPVELFAYHWEARNGQQVACVKFQGRDAQATPNLSTEITVGTPALSSLQTQGQIAEAFKTTIPHTNLTQGDLCKVHFKVYPWIGDASSVLDSLVDGFAWPTVSPRTALQFLCDKAGTYGGANAYVKAGATGGTASRTAATARAAPFPTIEAAVAAIATLNSTTAVPTHNDTGGGIVRLMDNGAGGGVAHQLGSMSGAAGKCWCRIELDPANTAPAGTVLVQTTGINGVSDLMEWAVPVEQKAGAGYNSFDGGGTARVSFEGSTVKQTVGGLPINYDCPYSFFRNVTILDGGTTFTGFSTFSTEPTETVLALGVVSPNSLSVSGTAHCQVGCYLPGGGIGGRPGGGTYAVHTQDLNVFANNYCPNLYGASQVGHSWHIDNGYALVQNVLESPNNQLQPLLQISADGSPYRLRNVLAFHNTVVGERTNWFYSDFDTSQGQLKRGRAMFNLMSNWNAKTDTFRTSYYPAAPDNSTGRVANWPFRYGVGAIGNVVMTGDRSLGSPQARAFLADYFPGGAYSVGETNVHFVNNQAPDTGAGASPGAGFGNYRLTGATNAAYGQVPAGRAILSYDIAGVSRRNDGTGAAGAYETTYNSPLGGQGGGTLGSLGGSGAGAVPVHGGGGGTVGDMGGSGTGGRSPALGSGGGALGGLSGSGEGEITDPPITATGTIIATADRTIAVTPIPSGSNSSPELPLDAAAWAAPLDPSDRTPFAIDWTALLNGETIIEIERIKMSAAGASLGVEVDTATGRTPIISTDGAKTQVWFLCDPAFQNNAAFLGGGVQVGLTVRVRTSGNPYKVFERTGILTVRQQ